MRIAYLDEAGISNPQQEPVLTVAGVLVDGDEEWRPLEQHFDELKQRFLPKDLHHVRDGFVFHAKEIWHGEAGTIWDRNNPQFVGNDRREALYALRDTILKFCLPIVFGSQPRSDIPHLSEATPQNERTAAAFSAAFFVCLHEVEIWMKEHAADENACIVVESNKQLYRNAKNVLQNVKGTPPDFLKHVPVFPFRKIIDTVYTAEKLDAPALQLADFCAFMFKRLGTQKTDVWDFIKPLIPLNPQLMRIIKKEVEVIKATKKGPPGPG